MRNNIFRFFHSPKWGEIIEHWIERFQHVQKTCTSMRKIGAITLLSFILFTVGQPAHANNIENTFWTLNGQNDVYLDIPPGDYRYPNGFVINYRVGVGGFPLAYYNTTGITNPFVYLAAHTDLPQVTDRAYSLFLRVNNHIYAQIGIMDSGSSPVKLVVPFKMRSANRRSPELILGIDVIPNFNAATQGFVDLRFIGQPQAGEPILQEDVLLATVYSSMARTAASRVSENPTPIYRIFLRKMQNPVPLECNITVNDQEQLNVEFGDIKSENITADGTSHIETRRLNYECNSGNKDLPVKVSLIAGKSSFSNDFIATSTPNLGIVMKSGYDSGAIKVIPPNSSFNGRVINGRGSDTISFALVKKPGATAGLAGDFSANGILIIETP